MAWYGGSRLLRLQQCTVEITGIDPVSVRIAKEIRTSLPRRSGYAALPTASGVDSISIASMASTRSAAQLGGKRSAERRPERTARPTSERAAVARGTLRTRTEVVIRARPSSTWSQGGTLQSELVVVGGEKLEAARATSSPRHGRECCAAAESKRAPAVEPGKDFP